MNEPAISFGPETVVVEDSDDNWLEKFQDMHKSQIMSYLNAPDSSLQIDENDQLLFDPLPNHRPGIPPIIKPPTVQLEDKFISLHKWEGIVTKVIRESFFAKLTSLFSDDLDEEAEFSIEEVSEEDKPLLSEGSVFYWNIGYHDSYRGQRSRVSIIRFRRLPVWTKRDIEDAQKRASEIGGLLGWQEPECSSECE